MPGYRTVFQVNFKNFTGILIISNLCLGYFVFINSKMTVFFECGVKCKLKGDVVSKDPNDLRLALDCMETKQGACVCVKGRFNKEKKCINY